MDQTEILALSFNDLVVMKSDFNEIFGELFKNARGLLKKELLQKLEEIKKLDYRSSRMNPKDPMSITSKFNYQFISDIQTTIQQKMLDKREPRARKSF